MTIIRLKFYVIVLQYLKMIGFALIMLMDGDEYIKTSLYKIFVQADNLSEELGLKLQEEGLEFSIPEIEE